MLGRYFPLLTRPLATAKAQVKLFTPGPLNTTETVKQAMMYDYGSRDPDFGRIVEEIKLRLLRIAGVSPREYAAVVVQGSGTFAVEATLGTAFPRKNEGTKAVLIASNGAYGERMAKICDYLRINYTVLRYSDTEIVTPDGVKQALQANSHTSHLAVVHSETTSGLINPVAEIAEAARAINPDICVIVDMVSCFGAIPLDLTRHHIDYIVSSSNKMIQGVPGFAFVIAKLSKLQQCKGNARSLALDLFDQWDYQLSNPGQFRFTPPTHVLSAFYQALLEHEKEGGSEARAARYSANQRLLSSEMQKLGFQLYIQPPHQGCIITTFVQPTHPNYSFQQLYDFLASRGIVIYPGKLSKSPSFRLGSIGELYPSDMQECVTQIKAAFQQMNVPLPLSN